jgi:hypothetical protein
VTWTGAANDQWSNAANWDTGVVPAAGDAVVIGAAPNACVVGGNVTVASLTVNGGVFVGGSHNITVNGSFNQTGGVFNSTSANLTVAGNFTSSAGFDSFNANGGTVVFSAAYAAAPVITSGLANLNNVTFMGSESAHNISGILNVEGALNLNSFRGKINNGIINAQGDVVMSQFGDYYHNPGTTTIRLSGWGAQTIHGISTAFLPNLQVLKFAGSVRLLGTVNVAGNYTWAIADSLDMTGATLVIAPKDYGTSQVDGGGIVHGDVAFSQAWAMPTSNIVGIFKVGGTLTLNSYQGHINGGVIEACGNVSMLNLGDTYGGSYGNGGTATVRICGGGAQVVQGAATGWFPNLEVNKPAGALLTLAGPINTRANFTWTAGDAPDMTNGSLALCARDYGVQNITPGGVTYGNVAIRTSNSTTNINGTFNVSGSLNLDGYNGYLKVGVIAATGNVTMGRSMGSGSAGAGNATIKLCGAGAQTLQGFATGYFPNITVDKPAGAPLQFTGPINTFGYTWINGDTLSASGSTLCFCSVYNGISTLTPGGVTYGNVNFLAYLASRQTVVGAFNIGGNFYMGSIAPNAYGSTGAWLDANLVVAGNVTAGASHYFKTGSSSVTLNGSSDQTVDLNNLTLAGFSIAKSGGKAKLVNSFKTTGTAAFAPGSDVVFTNGKTFTFTTLNWIGSAAQKIMLRSDVAGAQWLLKAGGLPVVQHVNAQDSDARTGSTIVARNSFNAGNNLNWSFAPIAVADFYRVLFNTALSEAAPGVMFNDQNPGELPIHAALVDGATHGLLTLNADGSFVYTPAAGYVGADSFVYLVSDNGLESDPVTVTIAVMGPHTWVGNGSDNDWNVAANWSSNEVPGDAHVAIFDGSVTTLGCNILASQTVGGVEVRASYAGTIQTSPDAGLTVKALNFVQAGGVFNGSNLPLTVRSSVLLTGGEFNAKLARASHY